MQVTLRLLQGTEHMESLPLEIADYRRTGQHQPRDRRKLKHNSEGIMCEQKLVKQT